MGPFFSEHGQEQSLHLLVRIHVGQIPSPSAVYSMFSLHDFYVLGFLLLVFCLFVCFLVFLVAVGLHVCLPKHQEGNIFHYCPRLTLDSCLCHSKLLFVYKIILSPQCTTQLATRAGLVQKCTILPEVGGGSRSDHVYWLYQSWFVTGLRPPLQQVSVRLFWSTPEFSYCVHTLQKQNQSLIQPS